MPPEAMRTDGTLFLYRDRVRIVAGKYTADHRRLETPHPKSILSCIGPRTSPPSRASVASGISSASSSWILATPRCGTSRK
jgi:hypothetical protein